MKKLIILLSTCCLMACGGGTSTGNPNSDDVSVTGSAVSAVGGALSSSSSAGTLGYMKRPAHHFFEAIANAHFIPEAFAATFCPTYKSAQGTGCTSNGSSDVWVSFNDCIYTGSFAEWNGAEEIELSSGTASCGVFPSSLPNGYLYRQFVTGVLANTPGSATVTSVLGATAHLDDATANLGNFDLATITPILRTGYGSKVGFGANSLRNSLVFGHHEYITGIFDHSLSGNFSITPTSSTTRDVTGSVTVYHNLLQIIGTVQFTNIEHTDSCCWPTSGVVTTTFSAGVHSPTAAGAAAVGKQETMTLTGCGTASLQSYDGTTKNVNLTRCY